jgi:hypothetical protein
MSVFQGLSGGKTEQLATVGVAVGVADGGVGVRVAVGAVLGVAFGVGVYAGRGVAVAPGGVGVRLELGVRARFGTSHRGSAARAEPICRNWPTVSARTSRGTLGIEIMFREEASSIPKHGADFVRKARSKSVLRARIYRCGRDEIRRLPVEESTAGRRQL